MKAKKGSHVMKVILLQDIEHQGKQGEVVAVSDGYARNYLYPRKLAVEAAGGALKNLQSKHAQEERRTEKLLQEAERTAGAAERKDQSRSRSKPVKTAACMAASPPPTSPTPSPVTCPSNWTSARSACWTRSNRSASTKFPSNCTAMSPCRSKSPSSPNKAEATHARAQRLGEKSGRAGGYNGGNGFGGGNAFGNGNGAGGPLGAYVPPHSIEAEQSTLGAMLIERSAVEKVFEILEKEDFYRENHQTLFDVVTTLAERDEPVDLITVQEELKNRDKLDAIGGIAYLTALFDTVPTAANVEYYARIVEEKATLRRLIEASLEIIGSARGEVEDVSEVLDQAERAIFGVSQQRTTAYFSPLRTLLLSVYDKAEELSEMKSRISGLSTGIHDFDMITSGLQSTDLIIVAARPSMGKTSLCLSIAEHVALKEKKPVAIFSLEMSKEQLALRMLCSQAQVNSHKLRTGI